MAMKSDSPVGLLGVSHPSFILVTVYFEVLGGMGHVISSWLCSHWRIQPDLLPIISIYLINMLLKKINRIYTVEHVERE